MNAIEAIAVLGPGGGGRMAWVLDWQRFEASGGRERKLSLTDIGMTAGEMRLYVKLAGRQRTRAVADRQLRCRREGGG